MNRERLVTDLHESVKSITDPDAFQRVIAGESADYVLADLRDRFWDGSGEKPWQVKEINRELTRRKEARATDAAKSSGQMSEGQVAKQPSLKERIENNLVVFFLGTVLAGFLAGLGTYQGALKLVDYTSISNGELRMLKDNLEKDRTEIAALQARAKSTEGEKDQLEKNALELVLPEAGVRQGTGETTKDGVFIYVESASDSEVLVTVTMPQEKPVKLSGRPGERLEVKSSNYIYFLDVRRVRLNLVDLAVYRKRA
jgi:hypothetical protein